jgi:hypothetical protein
VLRDNKHKTTIKKWLFAIPVGFIIQAPLAWAEEAETTAEPEEETSIEEGQTDAPAPGPSETNAKSEPEPTQKKGVELTSIRPSPPVNLRGTETLITEYVGNNGDDGDKYGDDDNYWTFRNLFYFQAGNRHFDSAIRFDATLFHNPPYYSPVEDFLAGGNGYTTYNYENDFRVERLYGTAHLDNLHLTVGDFYVNFGRGMVLSLIKQDDVGVDNALRGARMEYSIPRRMKAVLVGGVVNSLNIDPLTHAVQRDDPMDKIAGARIEWEALDALSLGVHGVLMRPRFTEETQIDPNRIYVDQSPGVAAINGGASGEINASGLHLYLEGNGQKHDNYRPPEGEEDIKDESGYAAYGEVSYDLSPFNIKAEGIFYRRWLMEGSMRGSAPDVMTAALPLPYHHMVTLEPMWMVIKSMGNAEGGRFTGGLYLRKSDTQFEIMTSLIKYKGGLMPMGVWDDHPPTLIVHPILEVRQIFGDSGVQATAEGGFRFETTDDPGASGEEGGHLWHAMADVAVPISGPHSIEAKFELRRHELAVTEGNEYWITLSQLGYEWSGMFGLSGVHEYSDQTGGNKTKIGDWELPLPRRHYLMARLNVHAPAPLEDLTLRLSAGSQRGGFKCVGGICRMYPDAVGAKLEAVYRF